MSVSLLFLLVGVALIATELLVMQFTVFWLVFFGFGALIASLVSWLMPEMSLAGASTVFLLSSLATALVLYPSLHRWQNKPAPIAGNDAIGQRVKVTAAISAGKNGKVSWSGTEWQAQLSESAADLQVGDSARILKIEGIRLIVEA